MATDWSAFRLRHPRWVALIRFGKRMRTKVAVLLVVLCMAEDAYSGERPYDLDAGGVPVVLGLLLIAGGVVFRIAAHGELRKKQVLSTQGAYSLCRHPLYLGSIALASGFCVLSNDLDNFLVMGAYFAAFYPVTILWEEIRLAERYGAEFQEYQARTPLLFPLGQWDRGPFLWRQAFRNGGVQLIALTVVLLGVIEIMAETL